MDGRPRSMICGISMVATTGITSIGSRSRCPRNTCRSRSPSQCGMDISCAAVTPFDAPRPAALSWSSWIALSSIDANAHRPSRSTASRVTRPVGTPFASRSTPSWSDRIPAASSAAEFASAMCPSARWITRGRGVTASSAARAGCVGSSQRDSSNPSITTGPSPSDARSRASVSSSAAEPAASTSRFAIAEPVRVRCTCVSMNPGRTVAPGRSTTRSASGGSPLPTR